jgi:hypothetical protein
MQSKPSMQSECDLTDVQTKMIVTLLAGQGGNPHKLVSSEKLAYLLGGKGKWSNYRHKAMVSLSERGIILFCKLVEGKKRTWHYSLREDAIQHLKELLEG